MLKFQGTFDYLLMCLKTARRVASSVDPDQTVASEMGLYAQACMTKKKTLLFFITGSSSSEFIFIAFYDGEGLVAINPSLLWLFKAFLFWGL